MSKCPFCGGKVTESVLIHGGTCPHCFGVIPGEESATDPGEVVRARLRQEDQAKVQQRSRRQAYMIAPFVVALVGVAAWALRPGPEVEPLAMGDDFAINFDMAALQTDAKGGAAAAKANGGKSPTDARVNAVQPKSDGGGPALPPVGAPQGAGIGGPAGLADAAARLEAAGQGGGASAGGVRSGVPGAGAGLGGQQALGDGGAAAVAVNSNGSVSVPMIMADRGRPLLTSDADIKAAVRDMVGGYRGQLTGCYEQALKADETFGGSWTVSFTITKEGTMSGVTVKANKTSNTTFEACIKQRVSAWRLAARLEKERSLSIPLGFTSGG